MGMLISAELPWDLTSHVHMQTSVTLVALIPVGEVTWIFVFFFSDPKGSEQNFSLSLWLYM